MCGIVGAVGKIWKKEEEAFKTMLQLDTIRGPHSTGVLIVGAQKATWNYLKYAGTPWELFNLKEWGKFFSKSHRLLLGHNRWATVGKIDNQSAHPFAHGDIIGVHNGTIRNRTRPAELKEFSVDSEGVISSINKIGAEETLKQLDGAFALVWYDEKERKVFMVRNHERPLWVCKSEDGGTYFWASEPWMMKVALGRNDIAHTEPYQIEVGQLISLDVPGPVIDADKVYLPKAKKVELYTPPPIVYTNRGGSYVPLVQSGYKAASLQGYLGKDVEFSVVGERVQDKQCYILCEVDDESGTDVRIFTTRGSKLYKSLLESFSLFKGHVKSVVSDKHGEKFLSVDNKTVSEIKEAVK